MYTLVNVNALRGYKEDEAKRCFVVSKIIEEIMTNSNARKMSQYWIEEDFDTLNRHRLGRFFFSDEHPQKTLRL